MNTLATRRYGSGAGTITGAKTERLARDVAGYTQPVGEGMRACDAYDAVRHREMVRSPMKDLFPHDVEFTISLFTHI
jgi:hypothetical protein